jgi:hypothetical protein
MCGRIASTSRLSRRGVVGEGDLIAGVSRLDVAAVSVDGDEEESGGLVDLDVHPRVIVRILRHADQAVAIFANASSKATQDALRRLAAVVPVSGLLLYFASVLGPSATS